MTPISPLSPKEAFPACSRICCPLCRHHNVTGVDSLFSEPDVDTHIKFHKPIGGKVVDLANANQVKLQVIFRTSTGLDPFPLLLKSRGSLLLWVCHVSDSSALRIATFELRNASRNKKAALLGDQVLETVETISISCDDVSWTGPPLESSVPVSSALAEAAFNISPVLNPSSFKNHPTETEKRIVEVTIRLKFKA